MALIAIGSAKGAPGVTTTALALASVWPVPVVLADCDVSGGDVGIRIGSASGGPLDPDRGLLSLGAAARHGFGPRTVAEHLQTLLGGLEVLGGLRSPEQAAGLDALWPALGPALRGLPGADVVLDVGRVGAGGPAQTLMDAADLVVLVTRTDVASLFHTRERLVSLTRSTRAASVDDVRTAVVLVSPAKDRRGRDTARQVFTRPPGELRETGADAVWTLPFDERGARLFAGEAVPRPERTALVRAAVQIAGEAAALVTRGTAAAPVQGRLPRPAPRAGSSAGPAVTSALTSAPGAPPAVPHQETAVRGGNPVGPGPGGHDRVGLPWGGAG